MKRRYYKRVIAAALAAGMVATLTACGGDNVELNTGEFQEVDPSELEKIFDPFVRGKNQPTGGGFGLGLAIAKRAVQRHGGTLTATNVKPHGLCMRIDIPLTGPNAVTSSTATV